MLVTQRYAYYRDAENKSEQGVDKGYLPPSEKDPEKVEAKSPASHIAIRDHFVAERAKGQSRKLPQLNAERYSDDRDAKDETCHEIEDCTDEASKDKPANISERIHFLKLLTPVKI